MLLLELETVVAAQVALPQYLQQTSQQLLAQVAQVQQIAVAVAVAVVVQEKLVPQQFHQLLAMAAMAAAVSLQFFTKEKTHGTFCRNR